jgi:MFS family permease
MLVLCNTVCVGAFGPLLPEIARAQRLADWQLGLLAGSFGLARMVADLPAGALAGRFLGTTVALSPVVLLAGVALLGTGAAFPVLVLGRVLTGLAHTMGMVGGLTAILQDDRGRSGSMRLNTFEFAGMLGVLGGLGAVGLMPSRFSWNVSLMVACAPVLASVAIAPMLRRRFPDRPPPAAQPARGGAPAGRVAPPPPIVWLMFALGAAMALSWSSVSQFMIPIRGEREFGLERAGISRLLALSQLVDLLVLLPVGWLADRAGRLPVLAGVALSLGLAVWSVGLGPLPVLTVGCALFGLGMAGWMLPLGVIRDHTPPAALGWRTGLYRVWVDAAVFLGPLICGLIGTGGTGVFAALVGVALLTIAARLAWSPLR